MTYCRCETIVVGGCDFYTRIIGNGQDHKGICVNKRGEISDSQLRKN